MKKTLFFTFLLILLSPLSMAQNFVTTWNVTQGEIEFGASTTDTVSYTWQTLPPAAPAFGSGTFTGPNVLITGLPTNYPPGGYSGPPVKIQLSIQPLNFNRFIYRPGGFPNYYGLQLLEVNQWGSTAWTSMENAFKLNFQGLLVNATDVPNLTGVTNMAGMFEDCTVTGPFNINSWNVSSITNMSKMFKGSSFNQALNGWNTSNVVNMVGMFQNSSFNQNIGSWNTSNVTNMSNMFQGNYVFNQNIGNWNTSNVLDMSYMFGGTNWAFGHAFNQNIGNWNTSAVTNMERMFRGAESFNQNIGNWNTGNVTNMLEMFRGAISFDQNIGAWNTTNVTNMSNMFSPLVLFNSPNLIFNNGGSPSIQNWNVANVTNLSSMFFYAVNFNHPLGNWTLNSSANMQNMLDFSGMDCANYSLTLLDWSGNPNTPTNRILGAANLKYGNSAVSAVSNLISNKNWLFSGHDYFTVIPAFSVQTVFCPGATIPALPLVSDNGIEGTWSPVLSTTTSGTYTFTPDLGQCADTTSLTITIGSSNTPTFASVAPICAGAVLVPLPTTSLNGVTGTWSPALNNATTTTYTFAPNAGQCATPQTQTIVVNPSITPIFTPVGPICAGGSVSPLPTTSLNGITGTWSPALSNVITKTYTFQPYAGQCASTQSLTIIVNPAVIPNFTAVAPICAGGTLAPLSTTSLNGITGTWSPALNNNATTNYTFTPTPIVIGGQCATTNNLTITVNQPTTPTFSAVPAICSGEPLLPLPTTSLNGIAGTWSPTLNNIATTAYTFAPSLGQCAITETLTISVNQSVLPTFAAVPTICNGGTLTPLPTSSINGISGTWSPALNNTTTTTYTFTPSAGQCATTQTLTITVNPIVTPSFAAVSAICAGTTLAPLPTTSTNGITGSWSPTLNNAATTAYTFTPTPIASGGQCATTQTLTITVTPNVTPTFTPVASICAGATLAPLPVTSTNGIAGTWSPALTNLTTTTYTFSPTPLAIGGQCATTQTLTITVNPIVTPNFATVPSICVGGTLAPLPTNSINGITGSWSPALNNSATTTYTFTPTPIAIGGQCASSQSLTITVNPIVTPNFAAAPSICVGGILAPLPTTSINGIIGSWSPALNNAATTTYTFTPTPIAIGGQCATTQSLTIIVNPNSTPTFAPVASICSGEFLAPLPLTSLNGIAGTWSPALNNMATTTYTFAPNSGQCAATQTLTITVNQSIAPTFALVDSICRGDILAPLPLTSLNGISGTWSPALNNTATTTYTFAPSPGQCAATQFLTITVNQNALPVGNSNQIFSTIATISDLIISPSNVIWYASLADAQANMNPLFPTTLLVNGATYFAVNTNGPCRSEAFPVTVTSTLSLENNTIQSMKVFPNPVSTFLQMEGSQAIGLVEIYNVVGQLLIIENHEAAKASIDLSHLPNALYFIRIKSGNQLQEFTVVKE